MSAWLQVRGRSWWSEREIAEDMFWLFDVRYSDHRGTARITHRPDLAVETTAGPVAIEVELRRKPRARLLGILRMYADSIDGDDAPLAGSCTSATAPTSQTPLGGPPKAAWLEAPALSFRTMDEVVGQARAAAPPPYDAP